MEPALSKFLLPLLCFLLLGSWTSLSAQEEPSVHLNSIRYSPNQADSLFLEHVLQNLLDGPQDRIFVANRDLLTSMCVNHCSDDRVWIHDKLDKKRELDIEMTIGAFDSAAHSYTYFEGEDSLRETIDGSPAYGGIFSLPKTEITSFTISIKGKELDVPKEAYANLYNPNLCESEYFRQPIAAYPSLSGKYVYVYVFGGSSSDLYVAKLIFDRKRFIKKIVAEYPDLSDWGAIREDFIGF